MIDPNPDTAAIIADMRRSPFDFIVSFFFAAFSAGIMREGGWVVKGKMDPRMREDDKRAGDGV